MVWLNSHYCKSDQFILGSDLEYQEALNYIVDLSEILLWLWIFREHGCRAQHLNGGGGLLFLLSLLCIHLTTCSVSLTSFRGAVWSVCRQRCVQRSGYVLPWEGGPERRTRRPVRPERHAAGEPLWVGDSVHLWVQMWCCQTSVLNFL